MRRIALLLALILVAVPGLAQKIYIDYDREADFDSYETFDWSETSETSLAESSPLMHSRVKNAIEYHLTQGGLAQVESDPDLYVTYHLALDKELSLDTTHYGYGWGGGWYWDPYWGGGGSSTTRVREYTTGTLIIDIWDAAEKILIWRGSSTAVVAQSPERNAKRIDKIVGKMAEKWQQMYEGM